MSRGVAYAVVHSPSPDVLLAEDIDVLQRVLALELVARQPPVGASQDTLASLRSALLEERWGDAVVQWMDCTGTVLDVYTHTRVYTGEDLPPELIGAQLQFTPLFRD